MKDNTLRVFFFMLLIHITVFSQINTQGKVTDSEGQPLPGASISEKGTSSGTFTDFDGNFKFETLEKSLQFYLVSFFTWNFDF